MNHFTKSSRLRRGLSTLAIAAVVVVIVVAVGVGAYIETTNNPPPTSSSFFSSITSNGKTCTAAATITENNTTETLTLCHTTTSVYNAFSTTTTYTTCLQPTGSPVGCAKTSSDNQVNSTVSTSIAGSETYIEYKITLTGGPITTTCCIGYITNYTTAVTDYTVGARFYYPLSINYNGSWILHYWVLNYSGTQNSINGNLNGSGNSDISITFSVVGYVEYTLCASATRIPNDSSPQQTNLPLTLSLFNHDNSTSTSNSTVQVCGTMAV